MNAPSRRGESEAHSHSPTSKARRPRDKGAAENAAKHKRRGEASRISMADGVEETKAAPVDDAEPLAAPVDDAEPPQHIADTELAKLRARLETLPKAALVDDAEPPQRIDDAELAKLRARLETLPPPPAEDASPEELARFREELREARASAPPPVDEEEAKREREELRAELRAMSLAVPLNDDERPKQPARASRVKSNGPGIQGGRRR